MDIDKRQEARAELAAHNAFDKRIQFSQDLKKAKLEQDHQLMIMKVEKRTALLLELFKSRWTQDKMTSLLGLIDFTDPCFTRIPMYWFF